MHRTATILSWLAVVSAAGAMGCSSTSSTAPMGGCDTTAPVSYQTDVIPLFQRGCTVTSSCHGQTTYAASENLYLGLNTGGGSADAQAVYKGLVGVPSKEDPSMNLVTAGSTDESYLWQKVAVIGVPGETLSASLASACGKAAATCLDCGSSSPCGGSMPFLGESLDSTDTCTLQGWILQGAKNN